MRILWACPWQNDLKLCERQDDLKCKELPIPKNVVTVTAPQYLKSLGAIRTQMEFYFLYLKLFYSYVYNNDKQCLLSTVCIVDTGRINITIVTRTNAVY